MPYIYRGTSGYDSSRLINSKLTEETIMRFDEELEQFIFEYYGLIFAWDEEPGEDYMEHC